MNKKLSLGTLLGTLLVVAVLVLAYFAFFSSSMMKLGGKSSAVFLSNGQVYFAKITAEDATSIKLVDIYYLRFQKDLQPKPEDQSANQGGVQLVKLGNELHGPDDVMVVNKDHVVFVEPLKDSSAVVAAIAQEKQSKEKAPAAAPAAETTPAVAE